MTMSHKAPDEPVVLTEYDSAPIELDTHQVLWMPKIVSPYATWEYS